MKSKYKFIALLLCLSIVFSTFVAPIQTDASVFYYEDGKTTYQFDTDNPVEFYETLHEKMTKDALFANGMIYFATKAKEASSSTSTKYGSIGWTIDVSNGYETIRIEVKKNGNYLTAAEGTSYEGYMYNLMTISYNDIKDLCTAVSATKAESIFSSSAFAIKMNAIMCVIKDGTPQGEITGGDGAAAVTTKGTVYYLYNSDDYNALKKIFASPKTTFDSFKNVYSKIVNNYLTINYYNNTGTTIVKTDGIYQFQSIELSTPQEIGLEKTGYHIESNASAWTDKDRGISIKAATEQHADELCNDIVSNNATLNLIPNWKPNTYYIHYLSDGGTGTMSSETITYDDDYFVPKTCLFQKEGYTFTGWKLYRKGLDTYLPIAITTSMVKDSTNANSTGDIAAGTQIRNLTTVKNENLYLIAQWEPNEYEITLNANLPAGKTSLTDWDDKLYLLYDSKYSLTSGGSAITKVQMPTLTGYNFLGYYDGVIDNLYIKPLALNAASGTLHFPLVYKQFSSNKTLIGYWKPVTVSLTLNADTTAGNEVPATQVVEVVYDQMLPVAQTPVNAGYTFKGFFTEENGNGICYYNELMVSVESDLLTDTTLYANWVDEVAPTVNIRMESSTWTNSNDNVANGNEDDGYKIEFNAEDIASGIERIEIYRENKETSNMELIYTSYGYGAKKFAYTHTETEEGAIRYKAVAYDVYGNKSNEVYATCYYDKTSPTIYEDTSTYDLTSLASVKATINASDNKKD